MVWSHSHSKISPLLAALPSTSLQRHDAAASACPHWQHQLCSLQWSKSCLLWVFDKHAQTSTLPDFTFQCEVGSVFFYLFCLNELADAKLNILRPILIYLLLQPVRTTVFWGLRCHYKTPTLWIHYTTCTSYMFSYKIVLYKAKIIFFKLKNTFVTTCYVFFIRLRLWTQTFLNLCI